MPNFYGEVSEPSVPEKYFDSAPKTANLAWYQRTESRDNSFIQNCFARLTPPSSL